MNAESSLLLTEEEVQKKIHRISCQVAEQYFETSQLLFLGVGERGYLLAELLKTAIQNISAHTIHTHLVKIQRSPTGLPIGATFSSDVLCKDKNVLLVDDVLNTGRTLAYSLATILLQHPKSVQTVLLIERSHKLFPIEANYVGTPLSTTLADYIQVQLSGSKGVYLTTK